MYLRGTEKFGHTSSRFIFLSKYEVSGERLGPTTACFLEALAIKWKKKKPKAKQYQIITVSKEGDFEKSIEEKNKSLQFSTSKDSNDTGL